jgi:hypothetical protein
MPDHDGLLKDLGLDIELHHKIFDSIDRNFRKTVLAQKDRPERMAYFDGVIHGAHGARVQEIVDRRAAGDKLIGTFCVYVPDELILALGAVPMALCGGTSLSIPYAEKMLPRDICPLVKSTLGLALSNTCPYGPIEDLAVGETTCDAKKKTWDILAAGGDFHVLEVPQKKGPRDRDLWHEEVVQFKARLEETTGRTLEPAKLAEAVRLMNRKRRALARLNELRKGETPPVSGLDALSLCRAFHRRPPVLGKARSAERRARGPGPPWRRRRPAGGQAHHGLRLSFGPGQLEAPPSHRVRGRRRRLRRDLHGDALLLGPRGGARRRPRRPDRRHRRPLPRDRLLLLLAER